MQRHHTGSGRRRVIPADWSEHHRSILDDTRDATVTLRRPGGTGGVFDRVTGTYSGGTQNATYYTGPARIQILPAFGQERAVAEQEVTTQAYAVMLDDEVDGAQLKDVLTVTAMGDNGDQDLIGSDLVISSIESGSLHWERRLIAILDLETPTTAGP